MRDWLPGVSPGVEMSLTFQSRKSRCQQWRRLAKQLLHVTHHLTSPSISPSPSKPCIRHRRSGRLRLG